MLFKLFSTLNERKRIVARGDDYSVLYFIKPLLDDRDYDLNIRVIAVE